jgi:predicted TIM-barrel fold metal-dependent hydrolase
MFGDDRVVFSVDYPFEDNRQASEWFNHLDLPSAVREKMAHGTADQLLRLPV